MRPDVGLWLSAVSHFKTKSIYGQTYPLVADYRPAEK